MSTEQYFGCVMIFLLGLSIGSFLNVLVYRLPRRLSLVKPPSSCPSCGHRLGALELIPLLGYLALKGRCLKCGVSISPRYPLVELATALIFAAVYSAFGLTLAGLGYMLLLALLLAVSLIDLEHRLIPNTLVAAGLIAGAILQLPALFSLWFDLPARLIPARPLTDALAGLALGGGLLLIIILASRGGMGAGDMKLMALIGFFVGLRGTAVVMMLGFTLGAVTGLLLILARRLNRKDAVPFGPFLSLAALIEIFYGPMLWDWYINLLR
jgi:leader peptidase (prepilin peptidase) / N-methyltransferase